MHIWFKFHVLSCSTGYLLLHCRVSGATQFLGFSKLLRLSSPNDAALGKLVTYCTGDQERIHEAIVNGVLLMGNTYNKHFFKMHTLNGFKSKDTILLIVVILSLSN